MKDERTLQAPRARKNKGENPWRSNQRKSVCIEKRNGEGEEEGGKLNQRRHNGGGGTDLDFTSFLDEEMLLITGLKIDFSGICEPFGKEYPR